MDSYRRLRPLTIVLIVSFFISCKQKQPRVDRSYYYWRGSGYITGPERDFVKQHQIHKIYARLMDVDWSEVQGTIPVSQVNLPELDDQLNGYDTLRVAIVPVVFLTNKTFEKIADTEIQLLAKRVVRRCIPGFDSIGKAYELKNTYDYTWRRRPPPKPKELQFDCDWTVKTSKKYFLFIKEVKKLVQADSILVSSTIRLHQYKYPEKTGVPPADRGMLMVYNISDPKHYGSGNSIFEYDKAKAYFTAIKKYPLPLDFALPAFSWCLVFRNGEFYQIENGLDEKDLQSLSFLKKKDNGFYKVVQDTVYRELFLRPGDEIKSEGLNDETMKRAAELAQKAVNSDHYSISFFELSEKEIKNYSSETIDKIYNTNR